MYKAMGDESAFRDGVFSHAAPRQSYQASRGQFADGSLGAFSRSASHRGRHGVRSAPRLQGHRLSGFGATAYHDGSLGQLSYTAFQDGSLGQAWRDGSLGADPLTDVGTLVSADAYAANLAPLVIQTIDARTKQEWFKLPQNQAVVAGLVVLTGAVIYLFVKK